MIENSPAGDVVEAGNDAIERIGRADIATSTAARRRGVAQVRL